MMLGKKRPKFLPALTEWKNFSKGKNRDNLVTLSEQAIASASVGRARGNKVFSLEENKKTVLIVGGSLGAKSINEAIDKNLDQLLQSRFTADLANRKTLCCKSKRAYSRKTISLGK